MNDFDSIKDSIASMNNDDKFLTEQALKLINLYESQGLDYPSYEGSGIDSSLKLSIRDDKYNTIMQMIVGKDYLMYYHLKNNLEIIGKIFKCKDEPYYTKNLRVAYRNPNDTNNINPQYAYKLVNNEIYTLDGNKVFEDSKRKFNHDYRYMQDSSKFDSESEVISYLSYDNDTEKYTAKHLVINNENEMLLSIPVGESEPKTLIQINPEQLDSTNKELFITNYERQFSGHMAELTNYQITDNELSEKMKDRAHLFNGLIYDTEVKHGTELIKTQNERNK